MAAKRALLTPPEQDSLVEWMVARKSESYETYVEWCEDNNVPPDRRFTKDYHKVWCQRRRNKIRAHRREYQALINAGSVLNRPARLSMLESGIARLTRLLEGEGSEELGVDHVVKLEEQRRKLLEAVSKERGEFGTKPSDDADNQDKTGRELAAAFTTFFSEAG